jgi:hypothetical protein
MYTTTKDEMVKDLNDLSCQGEDLFFDRESEEGNIHGIVFKQLIEYDDHYELDDIEYLFSPIHIELKKDSINKVCRAVGSHMYTLFCKTCTIKIGTPFC